MGHNKAVPCIWNDISRAKDITIVRTVATTCMVLSRQHLKSLSFFQRLTRLTEVTGLSCLVRGARLHRSRLSFFFGASLLLLGDLFDRAHINRMLGIL